MLGGISRSPEEPLASQVDLVGVTDLSVLRWSSKENMIDDVTDEMEDERAVAKDSRTLEVNGMTGISAL